MHTNYAWLKTNKSKKKNKNLEPSENNHSNNGISMRKKKISKNTI